jgi:soluble lytic murein transglycosylase-like protein
VAIWPNRLERWRPEVESAAAHTGLAPELIAAIMDRESLGGMALIPKGPAGTGDHGHGRGLMQVDDRAFPDFCAESSQWSSPETNIAFGARVLRRNLQAFSGDVPCAIAAYNAGIRRVQRLLAMSPQPSVEQLDELTTGRDYVSDVLDRLHKLQFDMPVSSPPEDGSS